MESTPENAKDSEVNTEEITTEKVVEQPQQSPAPQQPVPHTAKKSVSPPKETKKKAKKKSSLLLIVVVIVAVLLGSMVFMKGRSSSGAIDANKQQAVFLTNGQVYFGKLEKMNANYMRLTEVFYLQATTPAVTAPDKSKNPQPATDQTENDVQLIKLGNEVHGPEDEMIISKDQVLFFENLKEGGKVSQSSEQYYNKK